MKIKQLLLSFLTLSVFLVSCSKEELVGVDMNPTSKEIQTIQSTTSPTSRTLTETNLKAYVFIERQARTSQVVNFLRTLPRNPQSTGTTFFSYFTGVGIFNSNFRDLNNYYNMTLWNNGTLNQVISTEVPQVSGGVDTYGNPKIAYNFTTVKIPKGTLNEFGWVTILVPTSAMSNDTKRQTRIAHYTKINSQTVVNVNQTLSSYVIYSNGTVIPEGYYRVYSTYGNSAMRIKFNNTNDVYFRGHTNINMN